MNAKNNLSPNGNQYKELCQRVEQLQDEIQDLRRGQEILHQAQEGTKWMVDHLAIEQVALLHRCEGFPVVPFDEKDYEDWEW